MHAWRVHELGHYSEKLVWEETKEPQCPADGVVIEVAAAGLNFPDLLAIAGRYQVKPELPFVPGLEAVGSVWVAGPDSRFTPGQRVIVNASHGAYAEKMAARDAQVFSVPPAMSDEHAAAFLVAYQTSYFALVHRARLAADEVLLVLGGAGGVGTSAIQLGRKIGARVIAVASTEAKREHCLAAGAHDAIEYEGFAARVKELTGGRGADVVYDPVGGDATVESTRCIAWCGRVLIIGFASGAIPSIPANRILLKNISIVGLHWGAYFMRQPELIRQAHEELLAWYAEDDGVRPVIGAAYAMDELPKALAALEAREALGKLVVRR